uniref:F-box domain-containing protein n=1 Tax=Timema genevievae TaxID=629358 RepID=A0A7R9PMS5_TIMGE|nr:unnamed protein product [Timema genevievae]
MFRINCGSLGTLCRYSPLLANAPVVLSQITEDGEIEVRISVSGLRPRNALKKTCVTGVNSKEVVVDHFDSQMAQENIPTPESFFIFRRKKPTADDAFSKLSDEMVLTIFRHMPKKSLVRCAFVCKRWRRIAYDESLWSRLDLSLRTLRPGNLGYTLVRGVSILRLAQAEVYLVWYREYG